MSGFVPLIHSFLTSNLAVPNYPFVHFVGGAILYGLGAAFYVARIPEKYWSDTFDIWVRVLLYLDGLTKLTAGC